MTGSRDRHTSLPTIVSHARHSDRLTYENVLSHCCCISPDNLSSTGGGDNDIVLKTAFAAFWRKFKTRAGTPLELAESLLRIGKKVGATFKRGEFVLINN